MLHPSFIFPTLFSTELIASAAFGLFLAAFLSASPTRWRDSPLIEELFTAWLNAALVPASAFESMLPAIAPPRAPPFCAA